MFFHNLFNFLFILMQYAIIMYLVLLKWLKVSLWRTD